MRRALAVALVALAATVSAGLWLARGDTIEEMQGSLAVARIARDLARLPAGDPAAALQALAAADPAVRHVRIDLVDPRGRLALRLADEDGTGWMTSAWRAVASRLGEARVPATVAWPLAGPGADGWTVVVTAEPGSELREAAGNLALLFALMSAGCAGMLLAVHWALRDAFRPLDALLGAIRGVGHGDLAPVRALPPMAAGELEAVAAALRRLASDLDRAESDRRLLAHRLAAVQEDERQRLARDLHDEFGQRLTALRVDAAWLARRVADDALLAPVAGGLGAQVARIQRDLRDLLARLQPLPGDAPATLGTLAALLRSLAGGWTAAAPDGGRSRVPRIGVTVAGDAEAPLPAALLCGVYRLTQEALTNAVRHADAATVAVDLQLVASSAGGPPVLAWSVRDDGTGIADPVAARRRGSGLAGLAQRTWALQGTLDGPAPHDGGPGTHWRARLPVDDGSAADLASAVVAAARAGRAAADRCGADAGAPAVPPRSA